MIDPNLIAATQSRIKRLPGVSPYRSSGSAYNGLVFCLSTARTKEGGMREQAQRTLARLDTLLDALDSHRSLILQTTIYLGNLADKPEFDAVWREWIGEDPQGWPSRAGIGVALSAGTFCEVVLIAAQTSNRPGQVEF